MLNPEYADYEKGNLKVGFTDEEGEPAIELILSVDAGHDLAKMLLEQTNMKAQEERRRKGLK